MSAPGGGPEGGVSRPVDVASPCIGLCMMDDMLGHCLGCGRTRGEIGRWLCLSGEEKGAVVRMAGCRLGKATAVEPGGAEP
jgi:hypothetical protein